MAAPIRPLAAKTFGAEKVVFSAAIASIVAPTSAEVLAASNLDITCFLMSDWGRPAQNTNRVQLARRLCDTVQYEQIGSTNYTGGDLKYAFNPQSAAGSNAKLAYEKFPEGTVGFLIRRLVLPAATDLAAGQFVDVFPVSFGPQMPMPSSDDDSQEAVIMQSFAVTGPPAFVKAVAA